MATLAFTVSTLTDNVSQIDKVWSLLPAAYTWIFVTSMPLDPRVLLVSGLIHAWSLRLTY
jgi:steroid 5-alpha reductase family enzyme